MLHVHYSHLELELSNVFFLYCRELCIIQILRLFDLGEVWEVALSATALGRETFFIGTNLQDARMNRLPWFKNALSSLIFFRLPCRCLLNKNVFNDLGTKYV